LRQLLTESVMLGLLSGMVGVCVGYMGLQFLFGRLPGAANFVTPNIDVTVFVFALVISLATGLIFGTIPALKSSRASVVEALKEDARTTGRSPRKVTMANALLVGQVAFSFLLLVTAALFLRGIRRAYEMDPGFQTAHLAIFMTSPGQAGYGKAQSKAFYKEVRERVAGIPSVESVSWASNLPLWARPINGLEVEGQRPRSQADKIRVIVNTVDLNYFETAGVTLESGREFTNLDQEISAPVAIVNQKMAQDYWPEGALQKRIQFARRETDSANCGGCSNRELFHMGGSATTVRIRPSGTTPFRRDDFVRAHQGNSAADHHPDPARGWRCRTGCLGYR